MFNPFSLISDKASLAVTVIQLIVRALDKNEDRLVDYVHKKLVGRFPGVAEHGTPDELKDVVDKAEALINACRDYTSR